MYSIEFVIPGPSVGYYAQGKAKPCFGSDAYRRMARYHNYCDKTRWLAVENGADLPLVATRIAPILIRTICWFQDGTHPDPENVHKGIIDSLFYRKYKRGTADKYTGGCFYPPQYDSDNPRVEVIIYSA